MLAKVPSLLLILLLAPLARGQDLNSRLDQLAKSEKWLRLGHYEKGWFRTTSPFQGIFFLHPHGHKNPRAELGATVEAFLRPTPQQLKTYKMPPQCFFPARFRWLHKELKFDPAVVEPCTERKAWKKQLNATSVSLIFAAADLNNAPSAFGHTFLKLGNPENKKSKELIDYGINYAADGNRNESVFYALKGLFGAYSGYFTMLPYHQKIREYTNMEGRDLWEYRLNLSPEQVDELVDHFLEMEFSRAPYYFLSDNCSYQIAKSIEAVVPELNVSARLPVYTVPLDTVKAIAKTPGLLGPPKFQKSLKSDYLQGYARLNGGQREALTETIETLQMTRTKLEVQQQAEVYETAMKFYALKAYQTQSDEDPSKHILSVKRAKLGMVTGQTQMLLPDLPESSHDSGGVYFGTGDSEGHGAFYSVKARAAFHDLEQSDAGMVPFSHIDVFSGEIRYYPEEGRLSFHKFTLVDLLNSTPLTKLDKNLSWRARVEVLDQWVPHFEGGGGTTLDLGGPVRLIQLITAKYRGNFLGAGPNFILAARLGPIGVSFDAGYYFDVKDKRLWELKSRMNWQLARNWDLQFEHLNQREMQGKLLYNFLF
jgi:hypothetical protein